MKETIRLIGVMLVFGLVAGFLLAWTYNLTLEPIERARTGELAEALARQVPPSDNNLLSDAKVFRDRGTEWTFYVARNRNTFAGTVFKSASERGYGGTIDILIGVLRDSTILGVEILQADKETPGLGTKVKSPAFKDQFKGKSAVDLRWAALVKEGGVLDGVTGATISSRAVIEAVRTGLAVYAKYAADIRK
jgi:electron transport complex protein RnfG